jgi:hypothetical protein
MITNTISRLHFRFFNYYIEWYSRWLFGQLSGRAQLYTEYTWLEPVALGAGADRMIREGAAHGRALKVFDQIVNRGYEQWT